MPYARDPEWSETRLTERWIDHRVRNKSDEIERARTMQDFRDLAAHYGMTADEVYAEHKRLLRLRYGI